MEYLETMLGALPDHHHGPAEVWLSVHRSHWSPWQRQVYEFGHRQGEADMLRKVLSVVRELPVRGGF